MWDSFIVILLILELLLIGFLVYLCIKRNRPLILKVCYFILIFLLNFFIYFIALIHENPDKTMFDVLMCGLNSIKTFIFDADVMDYNITFAGKFPLYFLVYGLGVFMGAAMTLLTAFDVFKYFFMNAIKVQNRINKNADILIGEINLCKKYYNNYNNSIIWLDLSYSKEEVNSLMLDGYVVIHKEFNNDNLNKTLNKNKTYNIISFYENDQKTIELLSIIKENNNKFYVEVNDNSIVKDLMNNIKIFSKEELLIRKFIEENPLTKHLPKSFINADTTFNMNKSLNVIMVGFNGLHQQLLKQMIVNNQFAGVKDNKFINKLVNYHLFDNKDNLECNYLLDLERRFNELKDEYFELPEKLANINYYDVNINSYQLIKIINDIINDSDSFNYIFISNEGLNNYSLIKNIVNEKGMDNVCIYLNVDDINNENINTYGLSDDIINHDIIVNERLDELGININAKYSNLSKEEYYNKWNELDKFTKKSNIYAALNLRFKLNLLGLDYNVGNEEENLITNKIGSISFDREFNFYDNINIQTALIAQEHLRWNAFHLMEGYRPMAKKDIKDKTKNVLKKEHACLTTYSGLRDLAMYQHKMNSNSKIEDFDVYKYDLLLLSVVEDVLKDLGYKVINKD